MKIALAMLMLVLLAGCATDVEKVASIEDRSDKAITRKLESVDTKRLGKTTKALKAVVMPLVVEPPQTPSEETSEKVVTIPLSRVEIEVVPLSKDHKVESGPEKLVSDTPFDRPELVTKINLNDPSGPTALCRVRFDTDSTLITGEYETILEDCARRLKQDPSEHLILQGNTDERGSREYNLALGQRRAESVFKALNLLGVPREQMEAVSFGAEKPLVEGHYEAAWEQNRRVEGLF